MVAHELKELLELRRKTKDKEERAIIDRAIDSLINGIHTHTITVPSFPPENDDPSKWDVPFIQRWKPMCIYDPYNDLVNRQPMITRQTKSAAEADADNISISLK